MTVKHDPAAGRSPTHAPPGALNSSLERNIQALVERRKQEERQASLQDKVAARVSAFAGSMLFVYLHLAFFGAWITLNAVPVANLPRWDPSLVILAMIASVEAIFLSTFVLINQNRLAATDTERAELDLQISLLNEHETTRLVSLVNAIAARFDVQVSDGGEVDELSRDVSPELVLDRIRESKAE